ncbi:MAG: hypothetical protein AB7F96_12915 [Beijerinckiaceae bacterium]
MPRTIRSNPADFAFGDNRSPTQRIGARLKELITTDNGTELPEELAKLLAKLAEVGDREDKPAK